MVSPRHSSVQRKRRGPRLRFKRRSQESGDRIRAGGGRIVGREAELRSGTAALEDARIVTLTGVGGAGKTRLALQFAAEAQPRFRHGAWLCELAPLTSPDAVAPLVAGVMGVDPVADGAWTA